MRGHVTAPPKPPRRERKALKPIPRVSARRRIKLAHRRVKRGGKLVNFGDVMKVADDLWSVWVRAYYPGCLVCRIHYAPAELQCAHGWSRSEKATRFEPNNTFAACPSCHRRHTPPGPAWYAWMREHLGDSKYERIEFMARAGGKLRESDLRLVILDAQQRIAALPSGERKAWALERAAVIVARLGVRAA